MRKARLTTATPALAEASDGPGTLTYEPPQRAASLSEQAYETLLDMMLNGALEAGSVLQERRLAEALKISRTPVREALGRLEVEGLVARDAGRLMTVSRISVENYMCLLNVRRPLEAEAAQLAAGRLDKARAEMIRGEIWKLMENPAPTPAEHWAVDDLVHGTIAEATENPLLASMLRDLRRRTHMFNTRRIPSRLRPGCLEHLALIDAVAAGDAEKARALMVEHIDHVRNAIVRQLSTIAP
jgi:DNA-binding GntR family transcriptional regulator